MPHPAKRKVDAAEREAARALTDITVIDFDVLGVPAPQGSKTGILRNGTVRMLEGRTAAQRVKHRSWRGAVAEAARVEADRLSGPLDGALALSIDFRLPMPASRPKRVRELGEAWHKTRPDLSKLIRSTEDALTDAGLIADDARICGLNVTKIEVTGWTGASIRIGAAPELPCATAPAQETA